MNEKKLEILHDIVKMNSAIVSKLDMTIVAVSGNTGTTAFSNCTFTPSGVVVEHSTKKTPGTKKKS